MLRAKKRPDKNSELENPIKLSSIDTALRDDQPDEPSLAYFENAAGTQCAGKAGNRNAVYLHRAGRYETLGLTHAFGQPGINHQLGQRAHLGDPRHDLAADL